MHVLFLFSSYGSIQKKFKNLAEKKDPNTFEIAQLAANLTLIEHIFLSKLGILKTGIIMGKKLRS